MIKIYSDGSSLGNPGPGGLGVILEYKNHRKEIACGYRLTTNNRMELRAVIEGLKQLKKSNQKIVVISDSKYVVDSISKGWVYEWQKKNFKNKKNADLWQEYLALEKNHSIVFKWIKGHAGHPQNEKCDALAKEACQQPNLLIDEGYESSVQ